ncbi:MAG: Rpn family recombination-promoting nuclease/putative transposase [Lachnospiraceae bacterium]|nr:Rpn family recombination-promoting nuclease/putative transposase [Lachnospiraceae bacterium]
MGIKDITQKNYFTNDNRFAEFVNAVCFHGQKIIKPEELISVPEIVRKTDKSAILERTCDVVKKQTKDGSIYAIYVMENQDKVDYRMPIRVMLEEGLNYDAQIKRITTSNLKTSEYTTGDEYLCGFLKTDRLTPVYTIVVYWGDREWDGAKSLREMIDIPMEDEEVRKEMLELVPDYKIKVFDLNKETDFTAFGRTLKTVFEFYSSGKNKNLFRNYIDMHRDEVEALDEESKFFLATLLGKKRLAKELLKENQKEDNSMCKAIDDLIEDRAKELSEEYEIIIAALQKELEEHKKQKAKSMLEIEQLKARLDALV